jgi:hypothetical protein
MWRCSGWHWCRAAMIWIGLGAALAMVAANGGGSLDRSHALAVTVEPLEALASYAGLTPRVTGTVYHRVSALVLENIDQNAWGDIEVTPAR